jgi:D-beta-D-heptose 7-phosphate kinase/D-beta-D-heptose 1-phosphate adenosyltransferase
MTAKRASKRASHLLKWVDRFHRVPVLVVGDLMLDRSMRGSVHRISPEAPVPVVDIEDLSQSPGGAGNVAANLVALGAHPTLVSVRGRDEMGEQLARELRDRQVNIDGILVDDERPTITKTRIIAGHQQVVRLDVEKRTRLSTAVLRDLLGQLRDHVAGTKGVIISDYGKGVVTPPVISAAVRAARRRGVAVMVDPKIENFLNYRGVDCMTPNTKEAIEGMRMLPPKSEDEFLELGRKILVKLRSRSLLITRGEKGITLFEKGRAARTIPTQAKEVFDVTGAGDTVVATFSLARAVGAPYFEAAQIANYAASLVVAKLGTAVATHAELTDLLRTV